MRNQELFPISSNKAMSKCCPWSTSNVLVNWLIFGTLMSVLACALHAISVTALLARTSQYYKQGIKGQNDITDLQYNQIQNWNSKVTAWGTVLALLITPATIYCTYTHRELSRGLRIFMMAENITRLLYCLLDVPLYICGQFEELCSQDFIETTSLFVADTFLDRWLSLTSANCQMLVSINRFLALTFDGLYFKRSQKWPLVQLGLAGAVAAFESYAQFDIPIILIPYYPIVIKSFNFAMDCITFTKFKKRVVDEKVVERKLLIQMLVYQCSYVISYLILPPIQIAVLTIYGMWMGFAVNSVAFLFATISSTLGQSLVNLILIRNKKSHRQKPSTISITVASKIIKS